jgi:hypothetical protein
MENMARENDGWGKGHEVRQYPIDGERLTFNFGANMASKLAPTGHP